MTLLQWQLIGAVPVAIGLIVAGVFTVRFAFIKSPHGEGDSVAFLVGLSSIGVGVGIIFHYWDSIGIAFFGVQP